MEKGTPGDRAMAANVRDLLEAEGSDARPLGAQRACKPPCRIFRPDVLRCATWQCPEDEFDDDYLAVGFAFNQGGFRAWTAITWSARAEGFVDAALAATGILPLALDLSRVPSEGRCRAGWRAGRGSGTRRRVRRR